MDVRSYRQAATGLSYLILSLKRKLLFLQPTDRIVQKSRIQLESHSLVTSDRLNAQHENNSVIAVQLFKCCTHPLRQTIPLVPECGFSGSKEAE
jgi:hypothetical protein